MQRDVSMKTIPFDDGSNSDSSNRPRRLSNFIGQETLKENLIIFIEAAKQREEALDHVLFYGPPGLGKTTLSQIIARELHANIRITSGPILSKVGDLAAILTNLQNRDVLFIDEIHRLNASVEELLYSAMEDFAIDIVVGDGPAARTMRINLPPFTLIGATTRLGLLTNPLKDRFGIPMKLNFYNEKELKEIVQNGSQSLGIILEHNASHEIALRSRGTPRIALRILRRIRDFAQISNQSNINVDFTNLAFKNLKIDKLGLDEIDYQYLRYILQHYKGGPVGIETIASGLSEDITTIEDSIEPYLIQIGFVGRTSRGRVLSSTCIEHLQNS